MQNFIDSLASRYGGGSFRGRQFVAAEIFVDQRQFRAQIVERDDIGDDGFVPETTAGLDAVHAGQHLECLDVLPRA